MKSHQLHRDICPHCGYQPDTATGIDSDERPQPGNLSVCINCTGMLYFDDNLILQKLDEARFNALDEKTKKELQFMVQMLGRLRRKKTTTVTSKGGMQPC